MTDSTEHPNDSIFEAFVIGALEKTERARFIEHVDGCDACTTKLAREAKIELAMFEIHQASKEKVGKGSAPTKRTQPNVVELRPRRRIAFVVISTFAVAAALFFFLRSRNTQTQTGAPMTMNVSAPRETAPIPLVTCPDGRDQEKCVEEAHRHGLFVAYPPWAAAPALGGGARGRGPNGPPFGDQQM